ncbi:MAG: hypothetical protein H8D67_14975, partial [Deltaproteobacteria bacterium]|nr:hypothetical protein [Deltaproteobacteria bacterium]
MKITYIYGIEDLELQKFIYIGKGNDTYERLQYLIQHSHNDCVLESIREKGQDNFGLKVLETVEFEVPKDWIVREKFWTTKLREEGHPLCNKNDGGGGPTELSEEQRRHLSRVTTGKKKSKEHCANISRARKGMEFSESHRANIGKASKGRKYSAEVCEQRSKAASGENNPFYGKHHTEEAKAKQSKSHMGQEITEETRA